MKPVVLMLIIAGFGIAHAAEVLTLKEQYLKCITDRMNPYVWSNQSWWSNHWRVAAVLFDLNNDGVQEALVSTPDQQADKCFGWLLMQKGESNQIIVEDDIVDSECVNCRPDSLFVAEFRNKERILVGMDASVEKYVAQERIWRKTGDIVFRVGAKGRLRPDFLVNGVDELFQRPDFRQIDYVDPELYVGYDLKLQLGDKRNRTRDEKFETAQSEMPPSGFQSFVKTYASLVKQCNNLKAGIVVYAVFFDADKDGDTDFYLSSNADGDGESLYRWTLFINTGKSFEQANERVWFNRRGKTDPVVLEREVVTSRKSFYRVERKNGEFQIHVFGVDNGRLSSQSYQSLLSEKDRLRRPSESSEGNRSDKYRIVDWMDEIESKYGYPPPKDFRELVSESYRIMRLSCFMFDESGAGIGVD